jgi:hypothetical protein
MTAGRGSFPLILRKRWRHLKAADKKLAGLIERVGPFTMKLDSVGFAL